MVFLWESMADPISILAIDFNYISTLNETTTFMKNFWKLDEEPRINFRTDQFWKANRFVELPDVM